MNYKILIGAVSILLFFQNCHFTKITDTNNVSKKILIEKIICKNLSEKMAGIGSKNDEIILFVYEINQTDSVKLKWHSDLFVFEKKKEIAVNKNISFDGETLLFIMVEMDTDRNAVAINDILLKELKNNFEKLATPNLIVEKIKEAILDDDLLGIEKTDLNKNKKQKLIKFWGVHLFDEYEYEVVFGY